MNVSQNKITPNMQPAWKVEIQINNTVYTSKRQIHNFLLKNLPPQNIVLNLMFIKWNFIAFFKKFNIL